MFKMTTEQKNKADRFLNRLFKTVTIPAVIGISIVSFKVGKVIFESDKSSFTIEESIAIKEVLKDLKDNDIDSWGAYKLDDKFTKRIDSLYADGADLKDWRNGIDSTLASRGNLINRTAVTAYQTKENTEKLLSIVERLDSTLRVLHPNQYNYSPDSSYIKPYPRVRAVNSGGLVNNEEVLTEEMQNIFTEFAEPINN